MDFCSFVDEEGASIKLRIQFPNLVSLLYVVLWENCESGWLSWGLAPHILMKNLEGFSRV